MNQDPQDSQPQRQSIEIQIDDAHARDEIKKTLADLETRLTIPGLSSVLFHMIMELVTNAVKANLKRAYFHREGFSFDDPETYSNGIQAFGEEYQQINKEEFRKALKDLDLTVSIDTDLDDTRLRIYVQNNSSLLPQEEKRIREKLSVAMNSKRLMDFYLHYGDDTEGHGLGLAMVVLLIRRLGFDPKHFRVFRNAKNRTVARIEFPLDKDYVPIRKQMEEETGQIG